MNKELTCPGLTAFRLEIRVTIRTFFQQKHTDEHEHHWITAAWEQVKVAVWMFPGLK